MWGFKMSFHIRIYTKDSNSYYSDEPYNKLVIMGCQISDIQLPFDKEGRLRSTIGRVTGYDLNKAYALAGYLLDDAFKKYLASNLTAKDILKGETVDTADIKNEDYIKINQNKLGSLLNAYFIDHYNSVNNTRTRKGFGRLNGFTSAYAKTVAKNYTADLVVAKYRSEMNKPGDARKNGRQICAEVVKDMEKTMFQEYITPFAHTVVDTKDYSPAAKEYAQRYLDAVNRVNDTANEGRALIQRLKDFRDRKIKFDNPVEEQARINARIRELSAANAEAIRDRYVLGQNLVNLYGKSVKNDFGEHLINYSNLVAQAKGDTAAWFFQVFNTKKMTALGKLVTDTGEIAEELEDSDSEDGNIEDKYNNQDIDTTTKSWEDNLYTNYMKAVSGRVKMAISSIPILSSPYNYGVDSNQQNFDRVNPLGTISYMDPQYVSTQLFSIANDFTSVDSFIDSIEARANKVSRLYGLGMLVQQMRNNRIFANEMFTSFAKPVVNKTMITIDNISSQSGINFDYSNPNAFPTTKLIFDISNKLRSTYNDTYNTDDIDILNDVFSLVNSVIADPRYARRLKYKPTTDEAENTRRINQARDQFISIVSKYIPIINKEAIEAYFTGDNKEVANRAKDLMLAFGNIVKELGNTKTQINNAIQSAKSDYLKQVSDFRAGIRTEKPEYRKIDPSVFDITKTGYKNIIQFAKLLVDYSDSKARLNTVNAEGNTASDVIKNNYISRLFQMINSSTKEDSDAGLKALAAYLKQGYSQGRVSQYDNNPIFFGLKDINGNVIQKGIFTKEYINGEVVITPNPNAKTIIKYSLFDGSRNTVDANGAGYAKQSKTDFTLSQYIAFKDSIVDVVNDERSRNTGEGRSAVYSMRIGSDAPKIFFVRAPRYADYPTGGRTYSDIDYGLYGHVLSEFNMLVNALNNIFKFNPDTNNYELVNSVDGLYTRAYFDDKAYSRFRDGKGNIKDVFFKDGRLAGNMFNFDRLFEVNGYRASDELMGMLSLYGGSGLISSDINGNIVLNNDLLADDNPYHIISSANGKLSLNLNDADKTSIMNIIHKWKDNYLADANNRTKDMVSSFANYGYRIDPGTLKDYLLNSVVMNMNYDDLFEGDQKYYKNPRDFLKRTKESQAGGDGYAGFDINDTSMTMHELEGQNIQVKDSTGKLVDYVVPTYENGTIVNKPMTARNGFRAVTVYNTVANSDQTDKIQSVIEDWLKKKGISEDIAKERAIKIAQGYYNTTVNDAQSYITLEEFIRRRYADGTIGQYQDLLAQILDPNIPAEQLDLDGINARIQVQKNFYYDKYYDANTGEYVPRQIKNAEFVLIPKLLPKDSELRKVYDFMKKHDIGQLNTVETSKAAKKDILKIWDEHTAEFNDNFEDGFRESMVQDYYYQYLYKQQDVPQHMQDKTNKAGSQITKKIMDNVSSASDEVKQWVNDYQQAYTANIKDSFVRFTDRMGWQWDGRRFINKEYATTDANGQPLDDETIEQNKTRLDFSQFWQRGREEAARLGMDSNFMEYLIPDENGVPRMPSFMSNVMFKLESVAQALFNSAITRQTLPGWHGAQVTGVGYSHKLKFDAETGIMEVRIPRWSKLIPKGKNAEEDQKILEQISKEGLDIHIGYRIPTEGKQSISVMRVVGFTSEAQGSTIIVPDEWVAQTGSDFDVDSIYGISYEMYAKHEKDGSITVHKIPYEREDVTDDNLYIQYVKSHIDDTIHKDDLGNVIDDTKSKLRDSIWNSDEINANDEAFKELDAKRNALYKHLPADIGNSRTGIIPTIQRDSKRKAKKNKVAIDLIDQYGRIINALNQYINTHTLNKDTVDNIQRYIDYSTGLIQIMSDRNGINEKAKEEYKSEVGKEIQDAIQKAKDDYLAKIETAAKEAGLEDFETFKQRPFIERLSTRARNNFILDRMIKIMNDESSREEQYSRSQFDDLTDSKNKTDKLVGETATSRSPYNPLDQLDYFDDAMGGARLKAISVTWDTFISKCNYTHAVIPVGNGILIHDDKTGNSTEYNQIGWSKDNRNIDGRLVTNYTAETTAHTLDAVKEGSIQNVNSYTFGVYKLFTAVGLTFDYAVGFIRQPIITRLVQNYNIKNSIFFKDSSDPIKVTLGQLAKDLHLITKDRKGNIVEIDGSNSFNDIVTAFQNNAEFVAAFEDKYGINIVKDEKGNKITPRQLFRTRIPISLTQLDKRLGDIGQTKNIHATDTEQAVHDFAMLMNFNSYYTTASRINSVMTAVNIDTFGTKTSIHETRGVLEDIENARNNNYVQVLGEDGKYVNLADAFYPIDENTPSVYPSINAIYQSVTKPSVDINKKIFRTEDDDFVRAEDNIQAATGHRFSEPEYKEYKQWTIGVLYNSNEALLSPIDVSSDGRIIVSREDDQKSNSEPENASKFWDDERSRIYGYGVTTTGDFDIADVNHPTREDIDKFRSLTPAQKVMFIQRHFSDNRGIFEYIKPTIFNAYDKKNRGITRQYLTYDDQVEDIENLYVEFNNSFLNHNPLIKLAAVDLIKYAFIAEGFKFKSGYITKLITNDSIAFNRNDGGLGIIDDFKRNINNLPNQLVTNKMINRFVRSHPTVAKSYTLNGLPKKVADARTGLTRWEKINNGSAFRDAIRYDYLVTVDGTGNEFSSQIVMNSLDLFRNADKFIRVNYEVESGRRSTLFKVVGQNERYDDKGNITGFDDYYLIPLNLLDTNENYEVSYNQNTNVYNPYDYYYEIIPQLAQEAAAYRTVVRDKYAGAYRNAKSGQEAQDIARKAINEQSRARRESSNKVKGQYSPIGNFQSSDNEAISGDPSAFMKLSTSGDKYLAGGIRNIIDAINAHNKSNDKNTVMKPFVTANLNPNLAAIIPVGTFVTQDIVTDNGINTYNIARLDNKNRNVRKAYNSFVAGNDKFAEYADVKTTLDKTNSSFDRTPIYRISQVKDEAETQEKDDVRNADTGLIGDDVDVAAGNVSNGLPVERGDVDATLEADRLSSYILNGISYDASRNGNLEAQRVIDNLDRHRVDRDSRESLAANRAMIYVNADRYYRTKANKIANSINHFNIAGQDVDLSEASTYDLLAQHPEYYSQVADVLLQGLTFGDTVKDIMNIANVTDDKVTANAMNSIINTINEVRQNRKLRLALDNLFNVYFAKYSTNPLVINGLLKLREQFGDIEAMIKWIQDPNEMNNQEMQVVLKMITDNVTQAEVIDSKKNVQELEDELDKIDKMSSDTIDNDKIFDSKTGKFRQDHTEQFEKDRDKLIGDVAKLKAEGKEDTLEYVMAKFARDKFMAKYTEQPIVADYYDKELKYRETVLKYAPDKYVRYMELCHRLYDPAINNVNDEQSRQERQRIFDEMRALRNINNPGGEYLNSYLKLKKELDEKYFDYQEYDGFADDLAHYNEIIRRYDDAHKEETIDQKLQNAEYAEAYDWIHSNTRLEYKGEKPTDDRAKTIDQIISESFDIIKGNVRAKDKDGNMNAMTGTMRYKLSGVKDLRDKYGIIDGTKLNDAQIAALKQMEEGELSRLYNQDESEAIIFKDVSVPQKISNLGKNPLGIKDPHKEERIALITKINKILYKAVNRNTNRIVYADLFNDDIVSDEERDLLAHYYKQLRALRNPNSYNKNNFFTIETDDTRYNEARNFKDLNLKNTKQAGQFADIFEELDENGHVIPNRDLFGYKQYKAGAIDQAKTFAVQTINNNVEFIPTRYYWEARNKAIADGKYDEWFEANHVYDTYSHKYRPLKVWTTMAARPGSPLAKAAVYVPTFENMTKSTKEEYVNPNYRQFSPNYKYGNGVYDVDLGLNSKEKAKRDLYQRIMNKYATTYQSRKFVGQGFLPRSGRKNPIDTKWVGNQALSLFGLSWHGGNDSDSFSERVDYQHDKDADNQWLQLIKGKGTRDELPRPARNGRTDEEYAKALDEWKKENDEIRKKNLEVDNALLNTDWDEVMKDFVNNATIFNARQAIKPYIYMLLEELKYNRAYALKGFWNKTLVKDYRGSTGDDVQYRKVEQVNAQEVVMNQARRLIRGEYHENNLPRRVANFLQNMTSAKYMVFNLYGGIANVTTGMVNIGMERLANEYFGNKDFQQAELQYLGNVHNFLMDRFSDKSSTITTAFIKFFNVVDFDQVLQFGAGSENLDARIKQLRDFMYSFQSMGEHFMQNTALLAMLKGTRMYKDSRGNTRFGTAADFSFDNEVDAMKESIKDSPELITLYDNYLTSIKYDEQDKFNLYSGREDINRKFLRMIANSDTQSLRQAHKILVDRYVANRKKIKDARDKDFLKNPTVESLFEFKDGKLSLKKDVVDKFNSDYKNRPNLYGDLDKLVATFRNKVVAVNKKIHGVYDKNGAAMIENKWWGSLIAQYHKHLPMGILKRWRRKGYYNEFRGTVERGSYQTFIDFMTTEFNGINDRIKNRPDGTNAVMAAVQEVFRDALNTIVNLRLNYKLLNDSEKANMRRNFSDIFGAIGSALLVAAIYGLSGDDDPNDDTFRASCLYLADRLYSDSTMYSPYGLVTEYKTAWSSPVASANGPADIIKAGQLLTNYLLDPDFNPNYTTGQYKGENKLAVLLRRNIPAIRPWDRIQFITANNNYYKVGSSQIGIHIAKDFGEALAGNNE